MIVLDDHLFNDYLVLFLIIVWRVDKEYDVDS